MRVAVLGAGGLLGTHVVDELRLHEVVALPRALCDLGSRVDVIAATAGCGAIINCGAYTNVDGAETHEDEAYRVNALGAENAARAARAHGALLVHVSTDFVFDGASSEPYDEWDPPRPISRYGRSKWVGEELIRAVGDRWAIARVQGLYGQGGRNFSSRLAELVVAGKPLQLDRQRRVQPTWARSAARALVSLVEHDEAGMFHVSCAGSTTWAGFTHALCELLAVPATFAEVESAALSTPAARPPNCVFAHRMLQMKGLPSLPGWRDALVEYVREVRSP